MSSPVDSPEFWRQRIIEAETKYGGKRFSVYLTNKDDWKHIESAHKAIMERLGLPQARVLDAGCGYGRLSEDLVAYTGVDISPDFIAIAKERYPNKEFFVADLRSLPFKDGLYDWAVCVSIRQMVRAHLGEDAWEAMLKELKRVAGKVLILEYSEPEKYDVL